MNYARTAYVAASMCCLLIGCAVPITAPAPESALPNESPTLASGPDISLSSPAADPVNEADFIAGEDESAAALGEKEQAEENLLDAALEIIESAQEHWSAGDRERAMEALDQAYALVLNVPTNGDEKINQQKEDLRYMISKRILELYATRFRAANGNHNEIPLVINDHVQREIRLFQTIERDFFLQSYQRSGRYYAYIVKTIREAGLPEEIAWLPLIESGFKVRALSRARALGLWQFIPSTGYKFGLKRTDWVDERLDPVKATAAAIAYLKELHDIFGDWATVLAAYNCGEGNVLRVIRSQKINYLDNFWDLYERLPRETARYYPRFLAVLAIMKDPAKYGFTLERLDEPVPYDRVTVQKPMHLGKIADKIIVSKDVLADLNPELRQHATPPTSYDLNIPVGAGELLRANLDAIPSWTPPRPHYVSHRVRRGETLSTIALRYRTSVQKIMEANRLKNGRFIRAGQKLKIPLRESST